MAQCLRCNKLIDTSYWKKYDRYEREWFIYDPRLFCCVLCWYLMETKLGDEPDRRYEAPL